MDQPTDVRNLLLRLVDRTMPYDFTVWFWGDAIAMDDLPDAGDLLNDEWPGSFCLHFFQRWARQPFTWIDHLTPGLARLRLAEATADKSLLAAGQHDAA